MRFVTELYQVTFPLVPITAKLSRTYHLVQKCPFASLFAGKHPYSAESPLYPLPEAIGTWGRMGGLLPGMLWR